MDKSIARVIPELHLDRYFDYSVPDEMQSALTIGAKVIVPFGKRLIAGYLVEWLRNSPYGPRENLKPIHSIADPSYHLPTSLIDMAHWIADYYCAPRGVTMKSILPQAVAQGLGHLTRLRVELIRDWDEKKDQAAFQNAFQQRAGLALLQKLNGSAWIHELSLQSGIPRETWTALEKKGWVKIFPATKERLPEQTFKFKQQDKIELNEEQHQAIESIFANGNQKPFLLFGVTGSGKTEVYLQAIQRILDNGKNALVLVPEIALTPQIIARFHERFDPMGAPLAIMHSHLSQGERYDAWQRIRRGEARIVVGARSAIFAPLEQIGIIIVDEEHEQSYKNEECPHYHARDLAVWRAKKEEAIVILGSATPSVESWYNAQTGKYTLVQLKQRVAGQSLPLIHVLDQRKTKGALIHPELKHAIEETIARGEQTILLLNRRGYAPVQQCQDCGAVTMCPHCSIPLNFHRFTGKLHCHLCHYEETPQPCCKSCGSSRLKLSGAGTQKLEESIEMIFPKARIMRMDADNTRKKGAHGAILRAMEEGKIDILLGTQMIAKGLHFPRVTCVGIINTDRALQMPDFRSSERVFQIITQVAGRCGRSDAGGQVYLQTNTPYHPAIQLARHHDYLGFIEDEIEFRKTLKYPPIARAVLITVKGVSENKTRWVADQILLQLKKQVAQLAEIPDAPSPAPIYKIKDRYRYQIFLKTAQIRQLSKAIRPILLDTQWPAGIQCSVDMDPYDLL